MSNTLYDSTTNHQKKSHSWITDVSLKSIEYISKAPPIQNNFNFRIYTSKITPLHGGYRWVICFYHFCLGSTFSKRLQRWCLKLLCLFHFLLVKKALTLFLPPFYICTSIDKHKISWIPDRRNTYCHISCLESSHIIYSFPNLHKIHNIIFIRIQITSEQVIDGDWLEKK